VTLSTAIVHFLNRYILTDKSLRIYSGHLGGFLASSVSYPFFVVSKCMMVSSSGLAAGFPPNMPLYGGWTNCYGHLAANKQLKRGSSLFLRYYTGPQVIVGDKVLPMNKTLLKLDRQ